mmetsp:Transcript_21978/g.22156  ORF Transcript_21978/g.22156 Transcript_21978/m.22156 type:complete len:118 (+) Transcript_21978:131-484(+)
MKQREREKKRRERQDSFYTDVVGRDSDVVLEGEREREKEKEKVCNDFPLSFTDFSLLHLTLQNDGSSVSGQYINKREKEREKGDYPDVEREKENSSRFVWKNEPTVCVRGKPLLPGI